MKLTDQQLNDIKHLVSNDVKFNETYVEVYDHVITALESYSEIDDITKAYDEVIEQDFNGKKGLLVIERGYKRMFKDQLLRNKWITFWSYFKWPLLPVTILAIVLVYYLVYKWGVWDDIQAVMMGLICGPVGVVMSNNFLMKRNGLISKNTIKYGTFFHMAIYSYPLYIVIMSCGHIAASMVHDHKLINDVSMSLPLIMTACFIFCFIHSLSLITVYLNETKKLARI